MNSTPSVLKRHPLSAAFPDMEPKDYAELVGDIAKNGLLQPVVTFEGMILDGWHRYQASLDAGVKPSFDAFRGSDPVTYVISLNMHRRHLTGSQKSAAVVACHDWAKSGDNQHTRGGEAAAPPATVKAMAEEAGVSERTIQQAKKAHNAGLGEAVRDGLVTAERAAAVAKLPEPERQSAIEAPKPEPTPKAKPADVEALESELEDLKDRLSEMADMLKTTSEQLEAAQRVLDAEDLRAQFDKEVVRAHARATVAESRNRGLMNENSDLKGRLKAALRRIERLEKAQKEAE